MLKSLLNSIKLNRSVLMNTSNLSAPAVLVTPSVRYRYFEDKPRILKRNYGYEDKLAVRGPLARIPTGKMLPMPPYNPSKNWNEKKALAGQNDYIDILGDNENVTPIQFQTGIPAWLRGFQGKEYHMLLRKRALLGSKIAASRPTAFHKLQKRLKFLYRYLNYNTKNFMDKKVLRR